MANSSYDAFSNFSLTQECIVSVEGCSFNADEDLYSFPRKLPNAANWNGRTIMNSGSGLSHLIMGYPIHASSLMKNQIVPLSGSAGASAEGKTDSDGNSTVKGEVHVSAKDEDGNKVSLTAEVAVKQDGDGNVSSSGGIKVSVEKEF